MCIGARHDGGAQRVDISTAVHRAQVSAAKSFHAFLTTRFILALLKASDRSAIAGAEDPPCYEWMTSRRNTNMDFWTGYKAPSALSYLTTSFPPPAPFQIQIPSMPFESIPGDPDYVFCREPLLPGARNTNTLIVRSLFRPQ